MSKSSRTLKDQERHFLHQAQEQAAKLEDYFYWVHWMRSQFTYSLAVRMAIHLGFKTPSRCFYLTMRKEGLRRLKEKTSSANAA